MFCRIFILVQFGYNMESFKSMEVTAFFKKDKKFFKSKTKAQINFAIL